MIKRLEHLSMRKRAGVVEPGEVKAQGTSYKNVQISDGVV